jgi:prepilin-type N-terminal cleavage/methylation domain-containing protein
MGLGRRADDPRVDKQSMLAALARRRGRLRLRAGCERGFTLIELLVAMAMAFVVLTPLLAVLVSVQNQAAGAVARAYSVSGASAGLREMDQELRQA